MIALSAALGCETPGTWRPTPNEPATFALLLSGGGVANVNYVSHAFHLAQMHEALLARGLDRRQISVLAADGDLPVPDLAVGRPASAHDAWLLDGTYLERPLGHPIRYLNTHLPGVDLQAATRDRLDGFFDDAGRGLRRGDTLFLFVTDHGERGITADQSRITLWQRQSVSVRELEQLLGRLRPGVKVVTVMSQCFSGGFAELALEPRGGRAVGDTCGFFATTATRPAWGCYPESRGGDEEDGYAFKFIQALRRTNRVGGAHAETLISDRTPDVPLRSSDAYLARVVTRAAADRHVPEEALVDSLAREAMAADPEGARLIERVVASFNLPVSGESGADRLVLASAIPHLAEMRDRLKNGADAWMAALGDLTEATLDGFLAEHPDWRARVSPRRLATLSLPALETVQDQFVAALAESAGDRPQRLDRLRFGHNRVTITRGAALRSDVRLAALLRVRTLLVSLVGQLLLAREGSPDRRAELAALRACEDAVLPRPGPPDATAPEPVRFPPVSNDERLAATMMPATLGAALADVPAEARTAAGLPDGAAKIAAIDPASPASAAGLLPGDLLLGAPDQPVVDRGAMKLFLAARPHELEVRRGDRRLVVKPALTAGSLELAARDLRAAGRDALASLAPFRGPLADALGARRPYLLFFWATWCTFCKQSIPELLALQQARGLPIVAITDEPPAVVESFLSRWPGPFPQIVAVDTERHANEAFQVDGYPTFILVDENGRVGMRSVGYRAEAGLPIEGWRATTASAGAHH